MKSNRQTCLVKFGRATALCLGMFLGSVHVARAAETTALSQWPAWRGPLGIGVAPQANPPTEWSETKNVKWKAKLPGRGTASPIVWGNQVFILTAIPVGNVVGSNASTNAPAGMQAMLDTEKQAQQFTVLALDRQTGKTLWTRMVREQLPHEGHHKDHGFASGSPVTDGEHLFAYFGSFGLYCLDMKGTIVWEKDLGKMRTRNSFGEGASPALYGNTLIVVRDHEGEDCIIAFDKRDGKELWRKQRDEPTGWCTPLIVDYKGKRQVIVNGTGKVRSYDLETGDVIWECSGQTANAIPSAVADQDRAYVMSGFRGSMAQAIRLSGKGDLTGTDAIEWTYNKNTPYAPSPLLYDGLLYFFGINNAVLSIVETATGKPSLQGERLEGMQGVYASPVGASDRVYLSGRDGNVWVIKKSKQLEVLARNKLDEKFDASPAAVGQELFLRGHSYLYCLKQSE